MRKNISASEKDLGGLANVGWLSQQSTEFQARMARLGKWMTLAKGQLLYDVGDTPDAIFGLAEGLLDVAIPISADEMATLHRAAPGFWIGDSALLAETTRGVSVRAAADSRTFRLPADAVRRHLAEYPEDWACFFRLSHINVMLTVGALAEIVSLPPRVRFARLLLRQADTDGLVRASQDDLSKMAGMSRTTFRRTFASLIEAGIVQTEYGGLRILDRAALEGQV